MPCRSITRFAVAVAVTLGALSGCASIGQGRAEVVYREPGSRWLGPPQPDTERLKEDLDFAWLAESAYSWTPAAGDKTAPQPVLDCPSPEAVLHRLGWTRWPGFPSPELGAAIWARHLRIEVWMRTQGEAPAVAISFGGTVVGNRNDLESNLRWFLPGHVDEYSTIVQDLAPAFATEFRRRLASGDPAWRFLAQAKLYATGHSLGGGLAQQFAYALPTDAPKRVDKVYAYDPSPVTGYGSVRVDVRDHNRQGLQIDRVYERGEILALLRSLTSVFVMPSAENPTIRGVRYALFYPSSPIGGHSIARLACGMEHALAQAHAD